MQFTIAIIGMGLIGGSLAYAIKDFQNAHIIGADTCEQTLKKALEKGAVSETTTDPRDAISRADLVIFCVYPEQIAKIIGQNASYFKSGAVITDVCGIKETLTPQVRGLLPDSVGYIPCHPMAGKERGGFDNADGDLFFGAGLILTPPENAKQEHIELITSMARYIGATHIVRCHPKKHDELIAFTSHLPHITSSAMCLNPPDGVTKAFLGGSFRDCTRVANINADMWSTLFLENRENVLSEIERFQNSVEQIRTAVEKGDKQQLENLLETAASWKRGLL